MDRSREKDKSKRPEKQGPVIPAGTEQETGLTLGQTEKRAFKKARKKNNPPGR
jgi:hypothetical protein